MTMKAPSVVLLRRSVKNKGRRPVAYWALRWPGSDGKARRQNIGRVDQMTEREAGRIRRQKLVDLEVGAAVRDPARMTLGVFLNLDRDAIAPRVRPATLDTHRTDSKRVIEILGEDGQLDRVGWMQVAQVEKALTARCAKATVKRVRVSMRAAWNRAIKRGLVASNPWSAEKLPKIQRRRERVFTAEEVEAMCTAGSTWWAAFVRLGYTTGLRLGELLSLTWDDVTATEVAVTAKRAGGDRLEWESKSHAERRVPLDADAGRALLRLKVRSGSPYVFIDRSRLDKLLTKQTAGQLPQPAHWINNLPRDFTVLQCQARALLAKRRKIAVEKVEWERGTIHHLRVTFGTHMAQHVSMNDLRRLMGHASITTTADFYVGVSEDLAARVAAAFRRTA